MSPKPRGRDEPYPGKETMTENDTPERDDVDIRIEVTDDLIRICAENLNGGSLVLKHHVALDLAHQILDLLAD